MPARSAGLEGWPLTNPKGAATAAPFFFASVLAGAIAMPLRNSSLGLAALTLITFLQASAIAEPATDVEIGITVSPPAGYAVTISRIQIKQPSNPVIHALVKHETLPAKCDVNIVRARPNELPTQADRDRAVQSMIRRRGELQREFMTLNETFEYLGARAILRLAPKTGIETRSAFNQLQIWIYPQPGVIVATCTAEGSDFETHRAEFEAIVRGISFRN